MWMYYDVKSPGHGRGANYSLASFADTRSQPLMRDWRVHDRGPLSFSFRPACKAEVRLAPEPASDGELLACLLLKQNL